ncbi:MAG: hypothetical protein H0W71_02420 [Sphingomonas sp.]|nr:hypothetical protein [Sphingomonas sp.]
MNNVSLLERTQRFAPPVERPRAKDFVRDLGYQIGGLPVAVRGAFTRETSPEAVIRRAYAKRYWRPRNAAELVRLGLALVTWPIVVVALEIMFLVKNGAAAARQSGRPLVRQTIDQLKFYLCTGVLPPWYYIFELHRGPEYNQARDFIYRWEARAGCCECSRKARERRSPSSATRPFSRNIARRPPFAVHNCSR